MNKSNPHNNHHRYNNALCNWSERTPLSYKQCESLYDVQNSCELNASVTKHKRPSKIKHKYALSPKGMFQLGVGVSLHMG